MFLKKSFFCLFLFTYSLSFAQVNDNFEDGELASNPEWSGDTSLFIIEEGVLRSNGDSESSTIYISTSSDLFNSHEWQIDIILDFAPSGSNQLQYFLFANHQNLLEASEAMYLEIGESGDDSFKLYHRESNVDNVIATGTSIFNGAVAVSLLVKRNNDLLEFYIKHEDGAYNLDITTDVSFTELSQYFTGMVCHFTSSRADKFYFDNYYSGKERIDETPPSIESFIIPADSMIELTLSEIIEDDFDEANFLLNSTSLPSEIALNGNRLTLIFDDSFRELNNEITVGGLADVVGNISEDTTINFDFFRISIPEWHDVIINEIMADPTPLVELPEAEYLELKNVSDKNFDLQQLYINGRKISNHKKLLKKDSMVVLVRDSEKELFSNFEHVQGMTSWNVLTNGGEQLILSYLDSVAMIDSLTYHRNWYKDDDKQDGGYSLERIDVTNPCSEDLLWAGSYSESGGTPGTENSVIDALEDSRPPEIVFADFKDSKTIKILCNEPLNAETIYRSSFLNDSLVVDKVDYSDTISSDTISLELRSNALLDFTYTFKVRNIEDCWGNRLNRAEIKLFLPDNSPKDTISPTLVERRVVNGNMISLQFSEKISNDITSNQFLLNDSDNPSNINISDSSVNLTFPIAFKEEDNRLLITGIKDTSENIIESTLITFNFYDYAFPAWHDIIINEIMADPTPLVELPEAEYLEIKNVSDKNFNLRELYINERRISQTDRPLKRDSIILLVRASEEELFTRFNHVQVMNSWNVLTNGGEQLILSYLDSVAIIDSLTYDRNWYRDGDKQDGGYSLERIAVTNPCSDDLLWYASLSELGGTPGSENSVIGHLEDTIPPQNIYSDFRDSVSVQFLFDEVINPNSIALTSFESDSLTFASYEISDTITLFLQKEVVKDFHYMISISGIEDCWGNPLESLTLRVLLPDNSPKDTIAPTLTNFEVINENEIELLFSEKISDDILPDQFELNTSDSPSTVEILDSTIILFFTTPFLEEGNQLLITGIEDTSQNVMYSQNISFNFYNYGVPGWHHIVINEIMADPNPVQDLPAAEYLEIYNATERNFNLKDLHLNEKPISKYDRPFLSGEYLILTRSSDSSLFSGFSNVVGITNWNTLTNGGEYLEVTYGDNSILVDSLTYADTWYNNEEASQGGFALERFFIDFSCNQQFNWAASVNEIGGTPGAENSIVTAYSDNKGPQLDEAIILDSSRIKITFNEPINFSTVDPADVQLEGHSIFNIDYANDFSVIIELEKISKNEFLTLSIKDIADCRGNLMDASEIALIRPDEINEGDIVLNEILFDPFPSGVDFIEIINLSDKFLDLSEVSFSNDSLNFFPIASRQAILKPKQILALTIDSNRVISDYPRHGEIWEVNSLPPMNNDGGEIYIFLKDRLLDQFSFMPDFHNPILDDTEGISLERVSTDKPTNDPNNWHSAASTKGFATPGLANSQSLAKSDNLEMLHISSPYITPNQDGQHDFVLIDYQLNEPAVGTFDIYDPYGRNVKNLLNNATLERQGQLKWDGTDDLGNILQGGNYILVAEVFILSGEYFIFKKKIAVIAVN